MQSGIHLLFGLILGSFWPDRPEWKLGCCIGAILPDADQFLFGIAFLVSGTEDFAAIFHRTFSHSVVVYFIVYSAGYIYIARKSHASIERTKRKKSLSLEASTRAVSRDSNFGATDVSYDIHGMLLGLLAGGLSHTFLDIFYVQSVLAFWPFGLAVGTPVVARHHLSIRELKLLQTTDFATEIFLFYLPLLVESRKRGIIRGKELIYASCWIVSECLWVIIFVVAVHHEHTMHWNLEEHVGYLMSLGAFFLLAAILSPFYFRRIIRQWSMPPSCVILCIALFVFTQAALSLRDCSPVLDAFNPTEVILDQVQQSIPITHE